MQSTISVWDEAEQKAYKKGYEDALAGRPENNPYEESNHERDTTFGDLMHHGYNSGYWDGRAGEENFYEDN